MTRTRGQIEEHRKAEACIQVRDSAGRPRAGVPVWVEQETHAFVFGCVAPPLEALSEADRQRCAARLQEVFNHVFPADRPADPGVAHVDYPGHHLGLFQRRLDELSSAGLPLEVHVRGRTVGIGENDRAAADRVAEVYTLCFAHPAVQGIVWDGLWDGEEGVDGGGLLRLDFAPRPAFRYLDKLIHMVWHTRAAGETDAAGRFGFRGFVGDYRVGVGGDVILTRPLRDLVTRPRAIP